MLKMMLLGENFVWLLEMRRCCLQVGVNDVYDDVLVLTL